MDFSQYFSRLVRFKSIEKHVLSNDTFLYDQRYLRSLW